MPIDNLRIKLFSGVFIGFTLVACSNTNQPAPIRSITDTTPKSTHSTATTESSDYVRPPKVIQMKDAEPRNTQAVNEKVTSESNSNITYNRNYSDIPKGGYQGDSYTVKRGDTLFYIAWITGNDYRSLAQKNNITEPYALHIGQVLDVSGGATKTPGTVAPVRVSTPTTVPVTPTSPAKPHQSSTTTMANIVWRWPTQGKVIDKFSDTAGGNKGIDIAGSRGQDVVAAASGKVVYVGNALRGYGNLIIIKHDDDYLSAYAHNETMLVSAQQDVKAGQKIATMGDSGATSVRLHFEIRYKGKSMNPETYLPKK